MAIEEGSYAPEVLLGAEAVFVTNATSGMQVIERIEGFSCQKTVDFSGDCSALTEIRTQFAQLKAGSALQL
jgi:branched-subunit amino acid aminotransferase/4-amino-4-deoxychorismate lyase